MTNGAAVVWAPVVEYVIDWTPELEPTGWSYAENVTSTAVLCHPLTAAGVSLVIVTGGVVSTRPVPSRLVVCGELLASVTNSSLPVCAPGAIGRNSTKERHDSFG